MYQSDRNCILDRPDNHIKSENEFALQGSRLETVLHHPWCVFLQTEVESDQGLRKVPYLGTYAATSRHVMGVYGI